jgi:hypothetical protein
MVDDFLWDDEEQTAPIDDDSLNLEDLVQMGIRTAKTNPQGAKVMFQQVLGKDRRNERALLWMAYLTRDQAEQRRYLLQVLKVNPKNATAKKALRKMANQEKARANRTLFYGVVAIFLLLLLITLVVLLAMVIA